MDQLAGTDKGLYMATSMVRTILEQVPNVMGTPASRTERVVSWGAPVLANMLGMFVNLRMRQTIGDDVNNSKQWNARIEGQIARMQDELNRLETQH